MSFIPGAAGVVAQMPDGFTGLGMKAADAVDAATTYLSTMNDLQVCNLSTARVYTLPSTDLSGVTVKKGRVLTFVNRSAFDLSFLASAGAAMTIAGGANVDATISRGMVTLLALQDAPTTPAHWRVLYVYEEPAAYTDTTTGAIAVTATVRMRRHNSQVSLGVSGPSAAASAVNNITIPATNLPVRFRPVGEINAPATLVVNANYEFGLARVATTGVVTFFRQAAVTYTGTTSISDNNRPGWFSYDLAAT